MTSATLHTPGISPPALAGSGRSPAANSGDGTNVVAETAATSFRKRVETLVALTEQTGSDATAMNLKSFVQKKVEDSPHDKGTHTAVRGKHSGNRASKADRKELPERSSIAIAPDSASVSAVASGFGVQVEPQGTSLTTGKEGTQDAHSISLAPVYTGAYPHAAFTQHDKLSGPAGTTPLLAARPDAEDVCAATSLSKECASSAEIADHAQKAIAASDKTDARILDPREGASVSSNVLPAWQSMSAAVGEVAKTPTQTADSPLRGRQSSNAKLGTAYKNPSTERVVSPRPSSALSGSSEDVALPGRAVQPNIGTQPAHAFIHSPVAAHETVLEEADGKSANPLSGNLSSALRQTFTTLDSAVSAPAASSMHAERGSVEAGFDDPALGWIGVRAVLGHSGIHATVAPDSVSAEESVRAHLADLSVYLTEHHTPVETLTVAAPTVHSSTQWSGDAHGQRGGGQEAGQQGRDNPQRTSSDSDRGAAGNRNAATRTYDSPASEVSLSTVASSQGISQSTGSISLIA